MGYAIRGESFFVSNDYFISCITIRYEKGSPRIHNVKMLIRRIFIKKVYMLMFCGSNYIHSNGKQCRKTIYSNLISNPYSNLYSNYGLENNSKYFEHKNSNIFCEQHLNRFLIK
jgi:hypothetical protein